MHFTVAFLGALCLSSTWAEVSKKMEELKDKREAPGGYGSSHSSQTLQIQPSLGHKEASAISIGAGYSVGSAKPSFSYEAQPSHGYHLTPAGEQRASIQLSPITLQPDSGHLIGSDLTQIMNQLSEGLNSGAISLQSFGGVGGYHGGQQQQQQAFPQFVYGAPKIQQYNVAEQNQGGAPSYAASTKGLGSYSTGPVLFNPESHSTQLQQNYAPSHSFGDTSHAFASQPAAGGYSFGAQSFGGHSSSGHPMSQSIGGFSIGAQPLGGQSFGGHLLGGLSLGNSGHSFGSPYKSFASHAPPSRAFKPSTYLGSVGDSIHGSSGISALYGSPSLSHSQAATHGGYSLASGLNGLSLSPSRHAPSFGSQAASFGGSVSGFGTGSTKLVSPSYLPPKSEGFGSFESISAAFASNHLSSPPGTTYGSPSSSYSASTSGSAHAEHSSPQYYITPSKHTPSSTFAEGSTSYKAPVSSHSSLSSYSPAPKFGGSGHSSTTRFSSSAPKDSHGAYSESAYNTIKYSEELKPRAQA